VQSAERGHDDRVRFLRRIRGFGAAVRAARVPPPPKRKYDLIGEAMARPFGERIGRGRVRQGGVTDDDEGSRT
jgi:hypothetical protein